MLAINLVSGVVRGELDGVTGLAALAVSPAVAMVEAGAAAATAVRSGLRGLRQALASGLRRLADRIEAPAPVPARLVVPDPRTGSVMYAEEAQPAPVVEVVPEAPVILPVAVPMPSAAQVTVEAAPVADLDLAGLLETHGSVRAAARALGVAESTLRGRLRKAGVKLPGRKAKG